MRMEALMSGEPFRFLHASDLHLEQPLGGLDEIPDHLRDRLVDAPLAAARSVFDAAVAETVDFLVLAGDVFDPVKAGPRGLWFVIEQLERLAERKIMVYWAGGDVDQPQHWPATLSLPPNVHVFSPARFDEVVHRRGSTPIARLCGTSRRDGRELWHVGEENGGGLYTLWVDHTPSEPAASEKPGIDYWALGGSHQRKTLSASPHVVHFSGSPQGRHPREPGPHGCTLVYIDAAGQARTTSLTTDAVRFHDERLVIDEATSRDHLAAQIRLRARSLAAEAVVPLLVTWKIDGRGGLVRQIRRETFSSALVQSLRAEFGHGERIVWTLAVEADTPSALSDALYEQDTILGDYLRLIKDFQANPTTPLDLERYIHQRHVAGTLGAAARVTDPYARQLALHAAAELGADLLGGQ
jgi:DNA repair exonuclease SbcCD nuclease subunit